MFILKQKFLSKFVFKFMQVSTLLTHLQGTILDAIGKSSPVRGLGWPRGFQKVKVPRYLENGTG
jgi:hypothetical protein